jgi:GNAT superfamily N-acetyltransferase
VIRACHAEDLPRLHEVINEAAAAYKGVIPDDCWHDPYMSMDELLREAAAMTFHALDEGGRLVGVVGHQRVRDVTLLRHLYIETAHQRRGLGSQLLRQVVGLTATPRLLVGMWADAAWAVRFYARHGFVALPDSDRLLRSYWTIPARQREASLVMGREMLLSEA